MSRGAAAPLESAGLIAAFARNPVAANLLMIIFLIGGFLVASGLRSEIFPVVDPRTVTVTVPYPGATPTEVEEGITRRVEEALFGIDGIDRITSTAGENIGTVTAELTDFVDQLKVRNDIDTAVSALADFPPEDAEEPDISVADLTSDVISLVVRSEVGERHLRTGAEHVRESLLGLPEVSLVALQGARAYEITIEVSETALRRHGLTLGDVANAVRRSSVNLSSGELRTDAGDLLLRTNRKRQRGEEFEDIVLLADAGGSLLRLGDIATVRDAFEDVDLISELDERSSLFLQVSKAEADDALTVAAAVNAFLDDYQPLPGIEVGVFNDQSQILESRLSLLVRNGALGFALVFLFLVLMLDVRLALWVAMGVPIAFLGGMMFFGQFGITLNMISLFGLIIVLGIVVDDAIVVGENIVAEQEAGKPGLEGAIVGAKGVFGPVFVGVLTTIAAFAPLLLATGNFGTILSTVPIVVILVLTVSIIEVFCILPAHLSHTGRWSRGLLADIQRAVASAVARLRDNGLLPLIRKAASRRAFSLFVGVCVLVFSLSLVAVGAVRFIFFPALPSDTIRASLEMPIGTPFDTTRRAAERLLAGAAAVNDEQDGSVFESVSTTIGGALRSGGGPGAESGLRIASNQATIRIQLTPETERSLDAVQLERLWREAVGSIPGVESLAYSARFFGGGPDLEYELSHPDDRTVQAAAAWLKDQVTRVRGATEVADTFALGKRQYDITLTDAGRAAGLQPTDVARQLRQSFFGEEVQRIQRGRDELKVMVRYPRDERRSRADLENARIRLADGTEAPLAVMARLTESRGYSTIDRVDGRRIVSVTAKVDTNLATPDEVNNTVQRDILPELARLFSGVLVTEGGQGREQSEDLASLAATMLIAMLLIYTLLAAQLRSYIQPLIILVGVPFGAGGALIGHWLLGYDLSFISIFGMVALSGVVVNGSLVLVDRYNQLRRAGATPRQAIEDATRRRFRAIFLTTLTTALGLSPMLLETSIQAQFLVPMAVSLATGVVFASAIVLVLVPVLVLVVDELRERVGARAYAAPVGAAATTGD
ncbi:MAG: efflux RND transporter permease subunit [Pseudomonadota bacterium]